MNQKQVAAFALVGAGVLFSACEQTLPVKVTPHQTIGALESNDPRFFELIPPTAAIEKLAEGFAWSEGPIWMSRGGYLLFSDVPSNAVYKWKDGAGISIFLKPSGYTGSVPRGGEPGSNGLTVDSGGRLVLCEHGDRRVARLEVDGKKTTLADRFAGKRFNSPNDLVYNSKGDLYFTDPPYGLEGRNEDPKKELAFSGVYRLRPNGELTLLTGELTYPNGLAFSPDEKTLYVAVSEQKKPGLPDGMKLDKKGNLFATGPGGVFVFTPDGKHLGTINTGEPTANCNWGDDGSVLYITANHYLCRIKTNTKGRIY